MGGHFNIKAFLGKFGAPGQSAIKTLQNVLDSQKFLIVEERGVTYPQVRQRVQKALLCIGQIHLSMLSDLSYTTALLK